MQYLFFHFVVLYHLAASFPLRCRHYSMNHLFRVVNLHHKEMIKRGELPNHPEYLRQLEDQAAPAYSTGNLALDSILPVKVWKITALGIDFRGANLH